MKRVYVETYYDNRIANKILYIFFLLSFLPLLAIFIAYLNNHNSMILNTIATGFSKYPAITSAKNTVMTKNMDVYCKTAPFFAFILFLVSFNKRKIKETIDRRKIMIASLLSPLFSLFFIYIFLFQNLELTTAGKYVKYLSNNNITLLIFYSCLYYIIFLLSYSTYLAPVMAYRIYKGRQ